MANVSVYNMQGSEVGKIELNDAVFDLIDKVSESYKNEKGLPPTEAVPLCGRWDSNPHAQGTRS